MSQRVECKVCHKVFEDGSEMQELHDIECISREYSDEAKTPDFTLGEVSQSDKDSETLISPILTDIQKLRPISYHNGTFFIQVAIPVEKTVTLKDGTIEKSKTHETYYVTSNRELLHCQDEKLHDFQMPKLVMNNDFERWAYSDIVKYCSGETKLNIKELYESTEKLIKEYIDFKNDEMYTLVTLWTVGTYVSRLFSYFPYIDIFGTKGSAKSKLLSLLEKLIFNGKLVSSITAATLIRLVESCGYSLLIDETEGLKNPKQDKDTFLLTMLKTSYRMSAVVPINVSTKDGWTPYFFDAGTCISLAHINGLDDVLEDRTIQIPMEITLKKNIGNSDPDTDFKDWNSYRSQYYQFALENADEINEIINEKLEHSLISNRELNQIWKPIIVLAKVFEKHGVKDLTRKINKAIQSTHSNKISSNVDENPDVQLMDCLVKYLLTEHSVGRTKENVVNQKEIYDKMVNTETAEWLTSSKFLGIALKRLGLTCKRVNSGKIVIITDQLLAKIAKQFGLVYPELKDVKMEGVL
jgi:hypothetical protein